MYSIKSLLYKLFSKDAIYAAALCERLEDIKYCTDHGMNHLNGGVELEKWKQYYEKAQFYAEKDYKNTLNRVNMKIFKIEADKYLNNHPETTLYHNLDEIEKYAVRRFYYYNLH